MQYYKALWRLETELNNKLKNISMVKKEKKHVCQFCSKSFLKACALGGHISQAHKFMKSPNLWFLLTCTTLFFYIKSDNFFDNV